MWYGVIVVEDFEACSRVDSKLVPCSWTCVVTGAGCVLCNDTVTEH